jgi:hypothetical protein
MNRIAIASLVVVSMAVSAAVHAQAGPVAGTFGTVAPNAPASTPAAPAQAGDEGPPSRNDPRVCLEFPNNAQIIACAEKFRSHKRRAPQ